MPTNRVRAESWRGRTPMGKAASSPSAPPDGIEHGLGPGQEALFSPAPEQPHRLGFDHRRQSGHDVAQALGAVNPCGGHERP